MIPSPSPSSPWMPSRWGSCRAGHSWTLSWRTLPWARTWSRSSSFGGSCSLWSASQRSGFRSDSWQISTCGSWSERAWWRCSCSFCWPSRLGLWSAGRWCSQRGGHLWQTNVGTSNCWSCKMCIVGNVKFYFN